MRFATIIQEWFKDEWGGSLVLPDGWYGRPYDNQHAITSIDEVGEALTLILDQKLTLRFGKRKRDITAYGTCRKTARLHEISDVALL